MVQLLAPQQTTKFMIKDFLLSIIIPVYNEDKNIGPLFQQLLPMASKYRYELIIIDDGSSDDTVAKVKQEIKQNPAIKLISFTRNFGHQMAQTAGYRHALGDCVITMDADLQDGPELIDSLVKKWQAGYQIVYAQREQRRDSWFKRISAYLFYRGINFLSETPIPKDIGDFRLIDRKVVDFLNRLPERSRFLRGLVAWSGFTSTQVGFKRQRRWAGQTHYPFSRMINFAVDGMIAFSSKPLKLASYAGFLTSSLGVLGIVYALYRRFFLPHEYWVTGWTALFVAIMFFGGIQLITIGIIGEYIAKIYQEIQNRPQYVVKEKINF